MSDEFRRPVMLTHTKFSTQKIRKIRWLVEKASRGIHSNGHMLTADKKALLGFLAACKAECSDLLQLELLTDAQRE